MLDHQIRNALHHAGHRLGLPKTGVADAAGGAVRINPPLRGGIADGGEVNFLTARILCRLASDSAGRLALDRMHRGEPVTVPLVEAFDR